MFGVSKITLNGLAEFTCPGPTMEGYHCTHGYMR